MFVLGGLMAADAQRAAVLRDAAALNAPLLRRHGPAQRLVEGKRALLLRRGARVLESGHAAIPAWCSTCCCPRRWSTRARSRFHQDRRRASTTPGKRLATLPEIGRRAAPQPALAFPSRIPCPAHEETDR